MEDKKKYYISTAIAYTSGKPHIGNTYEIVLADAIARYKRFAGFDVYFMTGTDEHGEKIQQQAYCLEYTTYAGFDFKITAHSSRIDVQPKLGQNLNAIDIDLAILELEQYLQEKYEENKRWQIV